MKRVKVGIVVVAAVLAIGAIALGFLVMPSFTAECFAVPFQSMEVSFEDDVGVATIRSEAFRVAFEGQSFGRGCRQSRWMVTRVPPDSGPVHQRRSKRAAQLFPAACWPRSDIKDMKLRIPMPLRRSPSMARALTAEGWYVS